MGRRDRSSRRGHRYCPWAARCRRRRFLATRAALACPLASFAFILRLSLSSLKLPNGTRRNAKVSAWIFSPLWRYRVALILENPQRWRLFRGTRRALMSRFPYAIVYREITPDEIEIVAVAHFRRRPKY